MQIEIRCFYTMKGIGKESQKPFSFAKVKIPLRASSFVAGNTERHAVGVEDQEVEISPESVAAFAALKLPGLYEVDTEQVSSGGRLVTIFTGVRPIAGQVPKQV